MVKSESYLNKVKDFFSAKGYTVNIRITETY
jgi:hypothetical protein